MNKKNRFLLILALALTAAVFVAGCSLDNFMSTAPKTEDEAPPPGTNWVAVKVPKSESVSRSLHEDFSPAIIDYYEIFLRQRKESAGVIQAVDGTEALFFGKAKEGQVLRVAVPPGYNYDALLLGGRYENMILLASAFVNNRNASGDTEYVANGEGIPIIADQANVINLSLTWISSTPNDSATDGYTITEIVGSGTTFDVDEPGDHDFPLDKIYLATLPAKTTLSTGSATGIQVAVKTGGLTAVTGALVEADDNWDAGSYEHPTFTKAVMKITQYGSNHSVATMIARLADGNAVVDDTKVTYSFLLASNAATWPDPNPVAPNERDRGVYARMYYELNYYAFGRATPSTQKGSQWNIRNGYDPTKLDMGYGTPGGSILLIIGIDPGDFNPDEVVQIDYN